MGQKFTMEKHVEVETIPTDSIIIVKVDGIPRIEDVNGRNGNTWQKVSIRFKILGFQKLGDDSHPSQWEEMVGKTIFGSVPARFTDSPDNRLKQWTEAILGMQIGLGFDLDLDYFDGRQVRAVTSQYTNKNGQQRHQVESLLPLGDHKPIYYGEAPGQQAQSNGGWGEPQQAPPTQGFDFGAPPAQPAAQPAAQPDWGDPDDPGF